jgi:tRNA pseudouridine55 synthase
VIPAAEALSDWPSIELTDDAVDAIRHGHRIAGEAGIGKMARGISSLGELIALLEFDPDTNEWQPKKVFN